MNQDYSILFQPIQIKGRKLKNRIVMPPMVTYYEISSPRSLAWYRDRARGGVAIAIVGATSVNLFEHELNADGLKPTVDVIHEGGALAGIQLFPVDWRGSRNPADLDADGIKRMVSNYSRAAEACVEAGFDWLEPHGAHGYVLSRFFSPKENNRSDEYGGSLENRMRLGLEVARALKSACRPETILSYRHSPVRPGYGIEESLRFAKRLIKEGVDILSISRATEKTPGDWSAPFVNLGAPVLAAHGLSDPDNALDVLKKKRADLVGIGRGLIADPEWPSKLKEGRANDIVKCVECNGKCYGHVEKQLPVECTQWK